MTSVETLFFPEIPDDDFMRICCCFCNPPPLPGQPTDGHHLPGGPAFNPIGRQYPHEGHLPAGHRGLRGAPSASAYAPLHDHVGYAADPQPGGILSGFDGWFRIGSRVRFGVQSGCRAWERRRRWRWRTGIDHRQQYGDLWDGYIGG